MARNEAARFHLYSSLHKPLNPAVGLTENKMADINFDCPHCGHNLAVDEEGAGITVPCPECSKTVEIPFPELPLQSVSDDTTQTRPCPFCGEQILLIAVKCKHCGEFLNQQSRSATSSPVYAPSRQPLNAAQKYSTAARRPHIRNQRGSEKRILPLFLLYLFFGGIGGHAFYAGKVGMGIMYLAMIVLVGLGLGIGADPTVLFAIVILLIYSIMLLIDFIRILIGEYPDGEGNKIAQWT